MYFCKQAKKLWVFCKHTTKGAVISPTYLHLVNSYFSVLILALSEKTGVPLRQKKTLCFAIHAECSVQPLQCANQC